MLTLLDGVREGTHTLMMMKPGLLAQEVNTIHVIKAEAENSLGLEDITLPN